ncbi:MAG: AMP-binding protein [Deltaproteobacteria bacterium]|nr:AMP-binding protein [Deltaproteobacteria bacterium]
MSLKLVIIDAIAALLRILLRLRYRTEVRGLKTLPATKGLLILPNHPAEMDPIIVATQLWKRFRVRPVVLEKYYYLPVAHFLLKSIRAIPMPDMDFASGPYKRRRVEVAMQSSMQALNAGDNVLLYPSGRLMTGPLENVGGNSGVHTLLQAAPNAQVVLVRTRGLYGSIFSRACSGPKSPDFFPTILKAFSALLRNLIFFMPKREISVEFELAPADLPRDGDVLTLNRWLNEWYNRPGPDGPTLLSYSFWKEDLPALPPAPKRSRQLEDISPQIESKVLAKVASLANRPKESLHPKQSLGGDLGLDSLRIAELLAWLGAEFDVFDVELAEINSVGALLLAAAGDPARAPTQETSPPPAAWLEDGTRPKPELLTTTSLPDAFLSCCDHMQKTVAITDETSGMLHWPRLKTSVLLLADYIATLPGQRPGILLPASVGASLTTISAMLARKTPVMLNWTVGRRNLEHALQTAGVEKIITSKAFLDRLDSDLGYLEDRFLLLEELRKEFSIFQKLGAAIKAKRSAAALAKTYHLDKVKPTDPAVILFTSGSEARPKGVPLSHQNLLSNIASGLKVFKFESDDVMLAFLPPFHSFGLLVNTILPLITGLKAAYHPSPNESRKLAMACAKWNVSMMAGTPTFLRGILEAGEKSHFKHLRIVMAGADKAPDQLFSLVEKLGAVLVEGYGITECSPIVSVNRPGEERTGVGQPLEGVEILIVDHQSFKPLPDGECGLILIRGENVFDGYLSKEADPFLEVAGKRWYNSGDLGFLQNGSLVLAGRLKRFVKIGGEMISLPAIEDALSETWPPNQDGPVLAVSAKEHADGGRPQIHLFSSVGIDLERANQALKSAGLPALAKISAVHQVPKIPLLGTGKVDIQKLDREL